MPITGQDACLLGGRRLDTNASTVFDTLRAQSPIRERGTLALSFTAREAFATPAGFVAEYTLPSPAIGATVVSKIFAQGSTTANSRERGQGLVCTACQRALVLVEIRMGALPIPLPSMHIHADQLPERTPSSPRYEYICSRPLIFFDSNRTRAAYRKRDFAAPRKTQRMRFL